VYAERIPTTIEYLCKSLELSDPWVNFVLEQMRSKTLMLSHRADSDSSNQGYQSTTKSTSSAAAQLKNLTLSQLMDNGTGHSGTVQPNTSSRKRKLGQSEIVSLFPNDIMLRKKRILAAPVTAINAKVSFE